ncbi:MULTISPECIES: GGDEF domain-containing response regulator [Micromonospora]|uniref:Response regulator receiver modulated diguanylate cyclase n=1 Tax=Micromonospora yangpuensis TaxID=683228 RepID=A0A1C6UIS7_9ACTN|nr:response regulator [Micromonospora yangpuensis]GGM03052.1 diguanylate cyclase response regulator [Micromonospora yangpuensis]SCL53902.1 response regulator receiver modulated diguanylate cyclase [Micromonospora yangpuensis]
MEQADDAPDVILVVDDDEDIARFVEFNLRLHGFDVLHAFDGQEALEVIERRRPDLAVVDLMMPRIDGMELTRRLRANPLTSALPVIMLTAKGMTVDKVHGLSAGADDYLVKPFDTAELVARVSSTLRRNKEFREVSPLTGLPGNSRIRREIGDRVRSGVDYAVGYIDIDRFKSVNDRYGFVRGDEFISTLARSLHRAVVAVGQPPAFLGHVGGDDFVIVCSPDQIRPLTSRAVVDFETAADRLYDPTDAQRGFVELKDRRGNIRKAALVTLSIGVALSDVNKRITDPLAAIATASEMKTVAKSQPGSYVAVDRRRADGVR